MELWTRKNIQNYTGDPDEESDKKYSIEMQKIRNEIRKLDKETKSQGGVIDWLYIIYEVFSGEAGKLNASSGNAAAQSAFGTIRLIVTIGWAIYPIGYWVGVGDNADMANANLIYNYADFINKIAFGLAIYVAAVSDSE